MDRGWQPNFQSEACIYDEFLLKNRPQGKIGVLYQNDDYGKDHLKGLKDGLDGKMQIVAEAPYEIVDSTVDSQIISLKASGADIFFDVTSPKFAAQAIKKIAKLQWKQVHLLNNISVSVGAALKPASLDNSKAILTANYVKAPTDPSWKDGPALKGWLAFMAIYYPEGDKTSARPQLRLASPRVGGPLGWQCGWRC